MIDASACMTRKTDWLAVHEGGGMLIGVWAGEHGNDE